MKIKNKEITNHSNLKQEKKKNSNYSKLKIKVFLRTLGMIVLAFCIIFTLYRRFWFGRVGDWIVFLLQKFFKIFYIFYTKK